jgi:hypothetical protein
VWCNPLQGYGKVLKDLAFVAFILAGIFMLLAYQQMYSTLSVYLRDNHGINPQGYGFLMSTSAITVILFQFWVTRRIKHRSPFLMMALGTLFYMVGLACSASSVLTGCSRSISSSLPSAK